ncbi:uncharacterized protein LOC110437203 [Sorghum bicolor]|uniref:uncharacterized protein LOC110437203 n=1 Tax=Sorghum bicolor TaxID=4558 RepID=UPI000B424486|nr:uncharacterized protein LOC110437203 [Sorghum bicolor]|eukprot:XP_021321229.1 uncharacterized protein LOC110437203 [Sorghum bicolor]
MEEPPQQQQQQMTTTANYDKASVVYLSNSLVHTNALNMLLSTPHCVKKTAKQKRKSVDYSNVLLALPFCPLPAKKMVPGAAGKERAATNNNTTGGGPSISGNKNPKAARAPKKEAPMKGCLGDVTEPNEEAGTVLLQNPGNAEDTLEEDPAVQQPNDVNTEQQTIEEQAVVENQQDIVVNQQHLPEEQAGIVREQNIQNAIEENVPEDHAVFADIFNFPLNNELVDLGQIEDIMEDPAGVENKQNIINNQQHIPDQQAGIVQQQNPAENAIEVAEDDPTVFGDIFDFPLNNQLMDLD